PGYPSLFRDACDEIIGTLSPLAWSVYLFHTDQFEQYKLIISIRLNEFYIETCHKSYGKRALRQHK
ncbi:MAG: hypothetical protein RR475_11505, partial [Clostridia bacterium]